MGDTSMSIVQFMWSSFSMQGQRLELWYHSCIKKPSKKISNSIIGTICYWTLTWCENKGQSPINFNSLTTFPHFPHKTTSRATASHLLIKIRSDEFQPFIYCAKGCNLFHSLVKVGFVCFDACTWNAHRLIAKNWLWLNS